MRIRDIRKAVREVRNMEFIAEALRARRFNTIETLTMGFMLIDFARSFGKAIENA